MTESEFFQRCLDEIREIGPVVKGTLSTFNRKCGKLGCRKCASGAGHPSWILGYYANGRHTTCHVGPSQLEQVRKGIENYRKLEEALTRFGLEYIKLLKGVKK